DILGTMPSAFIKSYRIILPDLPGSGETGYVEGADYTITGAAESLEEFVRSMNIESFHLVGLSSSGAIAAYYASRYPSRVKTLSVMGPFGIQSKVRSDFQKVYDKGENPLAVRTPEEFDLKMSYIAYKPVVIPSHIKAYIAKESAKTYDFYINVFKREIDEEGWDMLRKHLKNIKSPTLVIFGDKDRFVDVSCIDVFKKEIKNVKAYVMKDSGHVTYMDQPDETNRVIMDFIKANTGR
ncbi:MAG TPA: alpha/beta hydrolase, partial [Spirochaetota bacterium]|nr:alpha/beta hydrolase [Spirochaetota bacterium]